MARAAAIVRVVWVVWVAYLHAVFLLSCSATTTAATAARVLGPDAPGQPPSLSGSGASLQPDPAERVQAAQRYAAAASELLVAAKQRGAQHGAGHLQLGWHYNKAVLDLAPLDKTAARQAAEIASSGWPFWLSWPETTAKLEAALGRGETAELLTRVRPRYPEALWENWWQTEAERAEQWQPAAAGADGGLVLPPPSLALSPFSSIVAVWELGDSPGLGALGVAALVAAAEAALAGITDRLEREDDGGRGRGGPSGGARQAPGRASEANEQLYEQQSAFYSQYATPMLPLGGVAAVFRQAAEQFLVQVRSRAPAWDSLSPLVPAQKLPCWHLGPRTHSLTARPRTGGGAEARKRAGGLLLGVSPHRRQPAR
eukprot:SAG22_NODE_907_length_6555_cov_19.560099_2_plen_371_part_00